MKVTLATATAGQPDYTFSYSSKNISVRNSSIKGRGLFASENIPSGEILVVQGGTIVHDSKIDDPALEPIEEICFQIERGFHICPPQINNKFICDGVFLMNHSCEPNCGIIGQTTFVAMRQILKGEEITFDYAMSDANYPGMLCTPITPMRCQCGTATCRKIITGDDWKDKKLQGKYKGYFSIYIAKMIHERLDIL